ncbi:MAG TPA: MlaD family protein [Solirubrobacteraceae bacterium]|nr:MlaD family protein [Solirubrobacteraceae bacterium]
MRRRSGRLTGDLAANQVLVGTIALLVTVIAVFLAYNANRGLPFVPTYEISVDVPDAAELARGDDVRIGGGRVGQVQTLEALPAVRGGRPTVRLHLALNKSVERLPVDTRVQVRTSSILGSKYLALALGRSRLGVVPGGVLPLRQATGVVELTEAFNIFDPETTRGIRGVVRGLGDALSGRGSAINETVGSTRRLLPPVERLANLLAAPRTDLAGFIRGVVATMDALAPVSRTLVSLVDHAAVTLGAIDAAGGSLGQTIEALPPTEIVGTDTLQRIRPVLNDAAAIAHDIRPGTRLLPAASRRLAAALEAGTPALRDAVGLAERLGATLTALDELASDPSATVAVRELIATVSSLEPTLRVLNPAQTICNVGGIWMRNVDSSTSEGDASGAWTRLVPILGSTQILQSKQPDSDLHLNYYPVENAGRCEAGNEPFAPGQRIGNPTGDVGTTVDQTAPPRDARGLAAKAGLLSRTPGAAP